MIRTRVFPAAFAALMLLLTAAAPLTAQGQPEADPSDVGSVDAIITALYASISGPVGQERDFDRFRSLFAPDGRLMPTTAQAPDGYLSWTPEEYWQANSAGLAQIGFTEAEIGRTTETFGMVTHAFSTYESYRGDQGNADEPFARGINSIQLVHHNDRYWILSISWDSERPGNMIPDRYIGG